MNHSPYLRKILTTVTLVLLAGCSSLHHQQAGRNTPNDQNQLNQDTATATGIGPTAHLDEQASSSSSATDPKLTYYFAFDSFIVRQEDRAAVTEQAKYLLAHPNAKILIEGNTDPRGSREYNVVLGENRANAVAHLLTAQGVETAQFRIVSYGAEKALPGHTEADYQQDRKVVIVYEQQQ